jgi:hypothetical protein
MFKAKKPKKTNAQAAQRATTLDDVHTKIIQSFRTDELEQELATTTDPNKAEDLKHEIQKRKQLRKNYYLANGNILMQYNKPVTYEEIAGNMNDTPFLTLRTIPGKKSLLDKYLSNVDPNFVCDTSSKYNSSSGCSHCGSPEAPQPNVDGQVACVHCGTEYTSLAVSDLPSFKDVHIDRTSYNYQRSNHFAEIVAQVQGRQNTHVSETLIQSILKELKKRRITDFRTITSELMIEIMRPLGYDDKYDLIQLIMVKIGARKPLPPLPPEVFERMMRTFNEAQSRWSVHKPPERNNFMGYMYVAYKIFELEGLHEYKQNCRLFRTRETLLEYDRIWKLITQDLGKPFLPTA